MRTNILLALLFLFGVCLSVPAQQTPAEEPGNLFILKLELVSLKRELAEIEILEKVFAIVEDLKQEELEKLQKQMDESEKQFGHPPSLRPLDLKETAKAVRAREEDKKKEALKREQRKLRKKQILQQLHKIRLELAANIQPQLKEMVEDYFTISESASEKNLLERAWKALIAQFPENWQAGQVPKYELDSLLFPPMQRAFQENKSSSQAVSLNKLESLLLEIPYMQHIFKKWQHQAREEERQTIVLRMKQKGLERSVIAEYVGFAESVLEIIPVQEMEPFETEYSRNPTVSTEAFYTQWKSVAAGIEKQVTLETLQEISRWAKNEMKGYVPPSGWIHKMSMTPVGITPDSSQILFFQETEKGFPLPSHHPLVFRRLLVGAVYDTNTQAISKIYVTIRGWKEE